MTDGQTDRQTKRLTMDKVLPKWRFASLVFKVFNKVQFVTFTFWQHNVYVSASHNYTYVYELYMYESRMLKTTQVIISEPKCWWTSYFVTPYYELFINA